MNRMICFLKPADLLDSYQIGKSERFLEVGEKEKLYISGFEKS